MKSNLSEVCYASRASSPILGFTLSLKAYSLELKALKAFELESSTPAFPQTIPSRWMLCPVDTEG